MARLGRQRLGLVSDDLLGLVGRDSPRLVERDVRVRRSDLGHRVLQVDAFNLVHGSPVDDGRPNASPTMPRTRPG